MSMTWYIGQDPVIIRFIAQHNYDVLFSVGKLTGEHTKVIVSNIIFKINKHAYSLH